MLISHLTSLDTYFLFYPIQIPYKAIQILNEIKIPDKYAIPNLFRMLVYNGELKKALQILNTYTNSYSENLVLIEMTKALLDLNDWQTAAVQATARSNINVYSLVISRLLISLEFQKAYDLVKICYNNDIGNKEDHKRVIVIDLLPIVNRDNLIPILNIVNFFYNNSHYVKDFAFGQIRLKLESQNEVEAVKLVDAEITDPILRALFKSNWYRNGC